MKLMNVIDFTKKLFKCVRNINMRKMCLSQIFIDNKRSPLRNTEIIKSIDK